MYNESSMTIATNNLTKQYGGYTALDDLNLRVPRNSIFGFLGPNGAGKTTTMKLLLGLIRPSAGNGTILGHDIASSTMAIRGRVGYLPQQPRFYEELTARETLHFTASFFFKGPQEKIRQRAEEMLALVGLEDKGDRSIKGFSGGERQRLGIAQAQINYPDLLILDEPAAALDPLGRRDVLTIMERLRKYSTIFYSTHILDDVQQVSDTVAILNQGRLIQQGAIDLLLDDGAVVYTALVKGDDEQARQLLSQQPWISSVDSHGHNGQTTLRITVNDEREAERRLLRLMLRDENLIVSEFGRQKYELEEVFIRLVEGGDHDQ